MRFRGAWGAGVLKGFSSIVSRKLASHGFGASMAAMSSFPPQRYHYFLVLDFEATCDKPQIHPQEIIEFPILKLNGRTMEIESTFHMYVQPVVHPQLTPFCTELTGIIQGMVDGQPSLQQVLERVDEWMAKEGLLDPSVKSIFVTCGDWDLKVMLPGQCQYLGLPVADYFKQWINLKKIVLDGGGSRGEDKAIKALLNLKVYNMVLVPPFQSVKSKEGEMYPPCICLDSSVLQQNASAGAISVFLYAGADTGSDYRAVSTFSCFAAQAYSFAMGSWPKNGLLDMNKGLNLQHIGRPHSGIDPAVGRVCREDTDDCKNIANIMKTLAHRGFIFKQTSKPF
ncbi:hypothetical protein TURU_076215 [Turdus rufiventris]|nr:hypothetical protein TURU_076215 [Turdus rufiventris]